MEKKITFVLSFFPFAFSTARALYSVEKSAGPSQASPGAVSERSQLLSDI